MRIPTAMPRRALEARLHPYWIGGRSGYAWSVIFAGELLVSRSTTPEFDAARVPEASPASSPCSTARQAAHASPSTSRRRRSSR